MHTSPPLQSETAITRSRSSVRPPASPSPAAAIGIGDRIDWLTSRLERLIPSRRANPLPPELEHFMGFLWPVALDYGAPVPRTFLHGFRALSSLAGTDAWIVRDGLIPLLWFFKAHPRPERDSGRLLVPASMAAYVPDAWQRRSETFRLVDGPCYAGLLTPKPRRRLLITGVAMDTYCSLAHLEKRLPQLVELARKENLTEFCAFMPARLDGYGNEHRHEYWGELYGRLGAAFPKLRFLRWTEFESTDSWNDACVTDLNEEMLIADSFLVHQALARGARVLDRAPAPGDAPETSRVQLSPNHALSCTALRPRRPEAKEMEQAFARAFAAQHSSEASRRFPWPDWHLAVARDGRKP